jgi:hypothetical protein
MRTKAPSHSDLFTLYELLQRTKEIPIWDCVDELASFFQMDSLPAYSDNWFYTEDERIRRYICQIGVMFDDAAKRLFDFAPHLEYYSKKEDFSFAMLRKVPEILIVEESPEAKFCFDRGIDFFSCSFYGCSTKFIF